MARKGGIARLVEQGIISITKAREQILDKGKKKYAAKKGNMVKAYKEAEETAKSRFALLFIDDVAKVYSAMWSTMKTNYEEAMKGKVEDIWAEKYGKKLRGAPVAAPAT